MFGRSSDRNFPERRRQRVGVTAALLVALLLLCAPAAQAATIGTDEVAYLIPDQSGQSLTFSLDHLAEPLPGGDLSVDVFGTTDFPSFDSTVSASGIDLMVSTAGLTSGQWRFQFALGETNVGGFGLAITLPGDATLDGRVDAIDLGRLGLNFGHANGLLWTEGDFSGEGQVDVVDLGQLGRNYGQSVELDPVVYIPVPAAMSAGLAMLGLTANGQWRRRRYD